MTMPGLSQGIAKGIGDFLRGPAIASLPSAVITAVIVVLFLGVTIFGSGEDGETKAVIRIAYRPATPLAPKAPEGASLIATNGAVISEPELIEMTSDGPLPKISDSGRKPMTAYARDYDRNDPRPKVALILTGLGLSATVTQTAVDQLPGGVTFSFTPYGSTLQGAVSTSRANGHEVLLEVPLEPYDYPDNDPGQNTLLTGKPAADNPARLSWIMSRATGYAGVLNVQGSKFLASVDDVEVLLRSTKKRASTSWTMASPTSRSPVWPRKPWARLSPRRTSRSTGSLRLLPSSASSRCLRVPPSRRAGPSVSLRLIPFLSTGSGPGRPGLSREGSRLCRFRRLWLRASLRHRPSQPRPRRSRPPL